MKKLQKSKTALISASIIVAISIMCLIGPCLTHCNYAAIDPSAINQPPSFHHIFGTDNIGRDIFARICIGGRVSLLIGFSGALIVAAAGVIYGGISGYFGGIADNVMMRIVEIMNCIPYLILVILISLIAGQGIGPMIIALTVTGWGNMARLVRGQVMQIKEHDYIIAAKALGASHVRIIAKHIFPNIAGIIVTEITLDIPVFIFGEAFLSFIGLGVQSPGTSWGALAASAQQLFMFYPYQIFFPSFFISLTMLSFNLLGDALRDMLDPQFRD